MPPKKTNAVNSVVNDLIRAAAGSSARNVADEDIDKYIADLILREAEEKRKKYDQIGVKAYQPDTPPSQKPKPNTRFLLNMVKATDSHNQAVIRANEENVAKLRQERLEREQRQREESRRRDDERRSSSHHRIDGNKEPKSKSKRERESPERASYSRGGSSSSSSSSNRHKRHRSKSPATRSRKDKPEDVQFRGRGKVKINSSMDKYFSEGYDPLLDVEDDYVFTIQDESKENKKKRKKKKKKSKHTSEDDTDSDSSGDIGPQPPVVRAWDVGKT